MKHLDPEDHDEMQEGETIQAFWSADKKFYEAEIVKISGECFQKKLEEREGCQMYQMIVLSFIFS